MLLSLNFGSKATARQNTFVHKPCVHNFVPPVLPSDAAALCLEDNGFYYVCGYLLRKN